MCNQTVHIGPVIYFTGNFARARIVRQDVKGRPICIELVTASGQAMVTEYDEEAMTLWDFLCRDSIDGSAILLHHQAETQAEFDEIVRDEAAQEHPPLGQRDHYTADDVITYFQVSRALDKVNREVDTLISEEWVTPTELKVWSVVAHALGDASDRIKIVDWDRDRVEVHRFAGETPHGHWQEWMPDQEAADLVATALNDAAYQKAYWADD
jgi:hypothetical protein